MKNEQPKPNYFAYLLRLWRVDDGDAAQWRASLQSACSTQLQGFSSLNVLFGFLEELTAEPRCPSEGDENPAGAQNLNAKEERVPCREASHMR